MDVFPPHESWQHRYELVTGTNKQETMWLGLHRDSRRLAFLRTTKRPVGMEADGTLRLLSRAHVRVQSLLEKVFVLCPPWVKNLSGSIFLRCAVSTDLS